jgi:V/A-type H+-transporting ATPase subunit I
MAKVEILGPKEHFTEVVSLLHDVGYLHIEEVTNSVAGDPIVQRMTLDCESQTALDKLQDGLVRVRAVIKALSACGGSPDRRVYDRAYREIWDGGLQGSIERSDSALEKIEAKVSALASKAETIENELVVLDRYAPILDKIAPLARQVLFTGAFEAVALRIDRRYKGALGDVATGLEELTGGQTQIVSTDIDSETTAAILVFSRDHSRQVRKYLADANVSQIKLPSEFVDKPFDEAHEEILEQRRVLPVQLKALRTELEALCTEWMLPLTALRDVLADRSEEITAISDFGQTEYAFVIKGWTPAGDFRRLCATLEERFHGEVIAEKHRIRTEDMASVPVAMNNPKIASPFESLLSVTGAPRYGTIDPTIMLALFYPLFFGMIVGDVGYGVVMLIAIMWIRSKYKNLAFVQQATSILGPAATMVIAFGFFYGEFFGDLGEIIGLVPAHFQVLGLTLPFTRTHEVTTLMIIALATGFLQVTLGLVLGIVNAVRLRSWSHLAERSGLLATLIGFLVLGLAYSTTTAEARTPLGEVIVAAGALALIVGAFFAFKGGKIMGAIEIIGQISNVFSYVRIMAVGLSGAIFADAVNEIVAVLMPKAWLLALIVGVALHSLNIAIASFSPNIHALRLNLLEFFGKFFEAGTRPYRPFHRAGGEEQS